MLDRSRFWSAPHAPGASLSGPDLAVTLRPAMPQIMISGDLDTALQAYGLGGMAGLMGQTHGPAYALRLSRTRALIVGHSLAADAAAWQNGVAQSSMTGALAVVDIAGAAGPDLVARGAAIDPGHASPSAALVFAGVTALLYRHDSALRLHLDRGLVPYLFDWIGATDLVA